jgi:drug/metabolite transporter (DMT)-like permease
MTMTKVSRPRLMAAFAAVYLIWGSTYLAIRFAIETIPPFSMAGVRFLIAGLALYGWVRTRGVARPEAIHWRTALIVGGLLLAGANGGVVWAEQVVPSGIAALIVATVPLWIATFVWLRGNGRPAGAEIAGLIVGFGGVAMLIAPSGLVDGEPVHRIGALVLIVAAFMWAAGSLYSRHAPQPASHQLASAMSMIAGGGLLVLMGVATGELGLISVPNMSLRSLLAVLYLIVFGSLVGFSAYLWLMKATAPSRAATYAYVNPVVAVFLGWALAGEPLTSRTLLAAAVIVGAVALIVSRQAAEKSERSSSSGPKVSEMADLKVPRPTRAPVTERV